MNFFNRKLILILFIHFLIYESGNLFLPKSLHVQKEILIQTTPEKIFPYLVDLKEWKKWAPWSLRDLAMVYTFSDQSKGVGARMSWDSYSEGHGEVEITEITEATEVPDLRANQVLKFKLREKGLPIEMNGIFQLFPKEGITLVIWSYDMDFEGKLFIRWASLLFKQMMLRDMENGLEHLKSLLSL